MLKFEIFLEGILTKHWTEEGWKLTAAGLDFQGLSAWWIQKEQNIA